MRTGNPARFEFATAARIMFGPGSVREAAAAAAGMGRRALVVTGASSERSNGLVADLEAAGVASIRFAIAGEPTVDVVRRGSAFARESASDIVVAMGGGSAMDAGKALAALLTNRGDPLEYLEVVGKGRPLEHPAAPCIAIPTTAGTGSEVTRNAVLGSPEHRAKASLRAPSMLPRFALVDPELTLDLPQALTASTGLDAITQLIEAYVSIKSNVMTDLFCIEGIRRAAKALPRAWENGSDREARAEMSWASLLGGLALANAGLGAIHGFAAPVGGRWTAPHGAVCAALLPQVMEVNVEAMRARTPGSPVLARYNEIGRLLTGQPHATAEDAVWWAREICQRLEVPRLEAYGMTDADIADIVDRAARASSMKGNPIVLTGEEMREIVQSALRD